MKVFCFACVMAFAFSAFADVLIFEDSFDGTSIDNTKWEVAPDQTYISVSSGNVEISMDGILTSKSNFDYPYKITGSFKFNSSDMLASITMRSNGLYNNETLDGFTIGVTKGSVPESGVFTGSSRSQIIFGYPNAVFLMNSPKNILENTTFDLVIFDYGDSFEISIDDSFPITINSTSSGSPNSSYGVGSKISLGYSFGPNDYASLSNIKIEAVPEPSALSLFAVGLSGLAMMRRRRS